MLRFRLGNQRPAKGPGVTFSSFGHRSGQNRRRNFVCFCFAGDHTKWHTGAVQCSEVAPGSTPGAMQCSGSNPDSLTCLWTKILVSIQSVELTPQPSEDGVSYVNGRVKPTVFPHSLFLVKQTKIINIYGFMCPCEGPFSCRTGM